MMYERNVVIFFCICDTVLHHSPAFSAATGRTAANAAGGGQHQGVVHPLPAGAVQAGQALLRLVRRPQSHGGPRPRQGLATAPGKGRDPRETRAGLGSRS